MPKRGAKRGKRSKGSAKGHGNPADRQLMASSHRGGPAMRVTVPEDMARQAISTLITQSPPKNLRTKIVWITQQVNIVSQLSISNSVYTEANYAFKLTDISNYSTWSSLFDQFCLYSVSISVVPIAPNLTTGALGRLTTAIDYDNTNNLSTEFAVQQYSSALTVEVSPGMTVQRFIKPCNKSGVYAGTSVTNGSVSRLWVDANAQAVSHYGFRSIWNLNNYSSLTADYLATYCVGFRNIQ